MTYTIKGIPISLRLILFFLVEAAGILIQILLQGGVIPGTIVMAAGWILVFARGYSNRPKDLGYEEWKPVSSQEFQRIKTNIASTKKLRLPLYYRPIGFLTVILFLIAAVIVSYFLAAASGNALPFLAVLDTVMVLFPLFTSGLIKLWKPAEMTMKVQTFTAILDESPGKAFAMTPYIRFDKDKEGRQIPEDVRFMLELRRNPEDFVGVQFQIAINNGPNGKVPYMYAVFLCRGEGPTFHRISNMDFGSFITEKEADPEHSTVVIRQPTKNQGYHTTSSDCRRLFLAVLSRLNAL